MRLILWIVIFVSTLAGASFGYYKFRQNQIIARPAYIEEFKEEAKLALAPPPYPTEVEAKSNESEEECAYVKTIDWDKILIQHTFLHGLDRQDIKADTIWTLRLSLLAFLGMEYELLEIERLEASAITYRRMEFSEFSQLPETLIKSETADFEHFRHKVCGIDRVRPMIYVASELGQVALPLPQEFGERLMNQADFRWQIGQRINKRYRININQRNWTVEDFLELMEQP
jgi:hypothetical protein